MFTFDGLNEDYIWGNLQDFNRWLAGIRFSDDHIVKGFTPCWAWVGARTKDGYGTFYFIVSSGKYRRTSAHVASYELFVGPVPKGLEIDHLCRNAWCVNPDHMEAVTHYENMRRRYGQRPGYCARDLHDLSVPENLRGKRACRPCYNAQKRGDLELLPLRVA